MRFPMRRRKKQPHPHFAQANNDQSHHDNDGSPTDHPAQTQKAEKLAIVEDSAASHTNHKEKKESL